jgi:DNA topoisomerase-1
MPNANREPRRLVIVESPTKANTIRRFLPDSYEVMASMGHVRDLPGAAAGIPNQYRGHAWARLGINVDDGFKPLWVVTRSDVVRNLKRALQNADELLIATDEDREGEAIGWHLMKALKPNIPTRRMVFHEITEDAIQRSLEETRDIDRNLVAAQEARRILDRLVGYTLSPLLWRKIGPRLSAGRVQSVAVRVVVQREKERIAFVPASYWDVAAQLTTGQETPPFEAALTHVNDIRLAGSKDFDPDTGQLHEGVTAGQDVVLLDEATAQRYETQAAGAPFSVTRIETKQSKRNPQPPFTTSTLQQDAGNKFGWPARRTMQIAQRLYEQGLITYMRTDSTNLSGEAIAATRQRVEQLYGAEYLFERVRNTRSNSRGAQEAHEAIRPAGRDMKTAQEQRLDGDQRKLYDLIWKRTMAWQMAEAQIQTVTAQFDTTVEDDRLRFRASGSTVLFAGFRRAYVEGSDNPDEAVGDKDQPLPSMNEGDRVTAQSVTAEGHETRPPARYTEASLVKLLEQEGIGRPSTYASIIETIQSRGYVTKVGNQMVPSFTAFAVNNLLEAQFERLVDTEFTARMEAQLDDIADGRMDAEPYLDEFYRGEAGIETLTNAAADTVDPRAISTIDAPSWAPFEVRVGRYGPYVEANIDGERFRSSIPSEWAPGDVKKSDLEELIERERQGDQPVGTGEDGQTILLKNGPYGPYLQLGEGDGDDRPKRVSLPPGVAMGDVDETLARALMNLPRTVGAHPTTDMAITAGIGRYGPYVRHENVYAPLKESDDVLTVGLERAVELINERRKRRGQSDPERVLGEHPETGEPVEVHKGRFGPYVKHQKVNASLRKDDTIEGVTLEQALELLAAREKRMAEKGSTSRVGKGGSRKKATGKGARSKSKRARPQRPKATKAQLEPYLDRLTDTERDVVARIEGMAGQEPQEIIAVTDALGLSEEQVKKAHKAGMFKMRIAFGKERAAAES